MGVVGELVSLALTLAGFGAVLWQIIAARRQQARDLQPRVFVYLRRIKTSTGPVLALAVQNVGRSPAMNVTVDFDGTQKWNHVSVLSYPFLPVNGGIRNLAPNTENTYRLGKLDKNLEHWLTSQAPVTVEFSDGVKRTFISTQIITLSDSVYLMEKR